MAPSLARVAITQEPALAHRRFYARLVIWAPRLAVAASAMSSAFVIFGAPDRARWRGVAAQVSIDNGAENGLERRWTGQGRRLGRAGATGPSPCRFLNMTDTPALMSLSEESLDRADVEGVAERRARFLTHAAAASQVAVYEFIIPDGAMVAGFNTPGQQRDARDQLLLAVALTGGAVGKMWGGLRVRAPVAAAERFETLARSVIEAFLVAYRR